MLSHIFNVEWLCAHHVGMSVLMVVLSILAFVACILGFFYVVAATDSKVQNARFAIRRKIGHEKVEKIKDKTKLGFLGLVMFAFVMAIALAGKEVILVAISFAIAVAFIGAVAWLIENLPRPLGKILGFTLFGIAVIVTLVGVGCIIHDLYGWWVLHICGA